MKRLISVLSLVALPAFAAGQFSHKTFMPPNDLDRYDNLFEVEDLTKEEFNQITDRIADMYLPIAAAKGVTLDAVKHWADPTVNAMATQYDTQNWAIHMYGGLARRPEVTKDGYAMVVCHELGHHFGGYPFYDDANWAASEGQSDYFAAQACLRYVWRGDADRNARARDAASDDVKTRCDAAWTTIEDQNLCYRILLAAKSTATLLARLEGSSDPNFDTPDTTVVDETVTFHPRAQCRLDTMARAALCQTTFDNNVIPGKGNAFGHNSVQSEFSSTTYSCIDPRLPFGQRPQCWFASKLDVVMEVEDAQLVEIQGNSNGYIEPGELASFQLKAKNYGFTKSKISHSIFVTRGENSEVLRQVSQFPPVTTGQTTDQLEPFLIKIADDAGCGDAIDARLTHVKKRGTDTLGFKFLLGRPIASGSARDEEPKDIPFTGSFTLNPASENDVRTADIKVRFSVPPSNSLSVSLVDPNLETHILFPSPDARVVDGVIIKQVHLTRPARGEWQLLINNYMGTPITLESWAIDTFALTCN